jgi:hypothetical protein
MELKFPLAKGRSSSDSVRVVDGAFYLEACRPRWALLAGHGGEERLVGEFFEQGAAERPDAPILVERLEGASMTRIGVGRSTPVGRCSASNTG